MSTRTQAHNRSMPNQWAWSAINVSSGTQALNRSLPNQWAHSTINVYMDTSTKSINAKPMGAISYQCLLRDTSIKSINAKPMGSISYQYQHGHKHMIINAKPIQPQSSTHLFRTRTLLLSGSNRSGVSISTNIFEVYMTQVKVQRHNYNSYVVIYITWLK